MANEELIYNILTTAQDCRTITEVAKKLYITQPYISQTLHNAEEKYQTSLIERNNVPIRVTEAGNLLATDLEHLLKIKHKIDADLAPFNRQKDRFINIAVNQPWITVYIKDIYKALAADLPKSKFNFMDMTTDEAKKALLTGQIDLWIGKTFNDKAIISQNCFSDPLYFLIPASSKLYNNNFSRNLSKKDFASFEGQNFISLNDHSFFEQMVDHMFTDNNIHLNKIVKVPNTIAVVKLALAGYGIGVVTKNLVQKYVGHSKFNLIRIPSSIFYLEEGICYLAKNQTINKKMLSNVIKLITNIPKK